MTGRKAAPAATLAQALQQLLAAAIPPLAAAAGSYYCVVRRPCTWHSVQTFFVGFSNKSVGGMLA